MPQIKISEDILIEVQTTLQRAALPGNSNLYTISSVEKDFDTFLPVSTCQYIAKYKQDKNKTDDLVRGLDSKYSDALKQFTQAMQGIDPTHAKDSYSTLDAIRYFENIYARIFHGQIISDFSPDLV